MSRNWKANALAMPGIGVSLLPKLACPLCWPAYASLLGSLGLGFLWSTAYLLPLTASFLLLSLGGLAFRAHSRHGYRPLLLGAVAAVGILMTKFAWGSKTALYGAIGMLIVASAWNAWPRRMKAELINLGGDDGCKETN